MPRPLTVVQILPALESGGVERGTLEVARELVRRGHRSTVVSGGGRLVEQLVGEGSEHVWCPIGRKSPLTLRHVLTLRDLLRAQQVDILHARSRVPAWVGWLAWKSLTDRVRPRLVTTVHGLHSVNRFSEIMTRGEAVIAVSHAVRDYIIRNYPRADVARIHVIPRGVDPTAFPHGYRPENRWLAGWQAQWPQLDGKRVLTLPGRLTRLKGHDEFLRLIAALKANRLPVHGLIVGDYAARSRDYAAEIRRTVADLSLSEDVTLIGHRSDIRDVYAVSSIVLSLSSKPESFGRTTLEALSLGVPVVGYDHGGVGEILHEAFPRGAVPKGHHRRLIQTVTELLSGEPPAVPPVTSFRLSDMLEQTIGLYESLVLGTRVASHHTSLPTERAAG